LPASVEVTRLVLRSVYANANGVSTLLVALNTAALATAPAVLAGKQVIEAQAVGVVTKYQFPAGAAGLQLQDVAAMWSRLLDLYDRALVATTVSPPGGGLAAESANIPDAKGVAIYNWMMGQLTVIRSFSMDHSWPQIRI
jgi:hypothetical protein